MYTIRITSRSLKRVGKLYNQFLILLKIFFILWGLIALNFIIKIAISWKANNADRLTPIIDVPEPKLYLNATSIDKLYTCIELLKEISLDSLVA